jgi:hypothetical protein
MRRCILYPPRFSLDHVLGRKYHSHKMVLPWPRPRKYLGASILPLWSTLFARQRFYGYAIGTWNRQAVISADQVVVGTSPDLRYNATARVRGLLEQNHVQAASLGNSTQQAISH